MHIANTVSIYANTFVAATDFQRRGWAVTPVKHQNKQPLLKNLERGGVEEESFAQLFCSGPVNLGIVLGETSSGLVDLDLDDPIALRLDDNFLPTTNCIFGRDSNPRSHRIYQVRSPGKIADFVADGETILEIRGSKH